jgi:hypothetical protein
MLNIFMQYRHMLITRLDIRENQSPLPSPPTTSARPWAAPDLSTLELSLVNVDISHGSSS